MVDMIALGMSVILCLFHMFSASYGTWTSYVLAAVHWGFIGSYIVLRKPTKLKYIGPVYDAVIIILTIYACYHQVAMQARLVTQAGLYTTEDIIVAVIAVLLVLEVGRRAVGKILPLIGVAFLLYCYFGNMVPGLMKTTRFTVNRIAIFIYTSSDGIFGQTLYVSAKYIFLFILFGSILELTGAGAFFVDLAFAFVGKARGGPAQAAIYSSMLMGTINGSGAANVVTTGTFTIPLMKKTGYTKEFAGAVEATASVGGQLLPPIMGAAAFVMAETLGVQYGVIIKAAVIPALIYYLGIIIQVQMRAIKDHLVGLPKELMPRAGQVMKERGHLLIPILFLLYMLIWSGKTVIFSAFWTILLTIVFAEFRKISRMSLKDVGDAFVAGAKSTVSVAIACACVGIIVGICGLTGFALAVANTIISIGRNSLFLTLLFTMVTCMILGMGLPSIPSYLITATIAAPALVELGQPAIAAHMFCFYFAMFANLTPPVALASFAAAGLSGGDPMKTGFASVKLALSGFIVPFMFMYNEQLLLENVTFLSGLQVVVTSCIGVVLISAAVEGYLWGRLNIVFRAVAFCAALLLIDSQMVTDLIGIGGLVFIILCQKFLNKKRNPLSANPS